MQCRIDNDHWEHVGKTYFVHEARTREGSTAVDLTLEDEHGYIINTVVANHQIEWLEDNS